MTLPLLIGTLLALAVGLMCTIVGMDRDRALYPAVTVVVGALYSLFAVMGASTDTLLLEILAGSVFVAAALWGFKSSLWIVVVALAAHGVFDFFHEHVIPDPGVPAFWPGFCGAYDVVAAGYLALLIKVGRVRASAR